MADGINLNDLLEEAAGGAADTSTETEEQAEEITETETTETETNTEGTSTTESTTEAETKPEEQNAAAAQKKPNPMKEVRDRLNSEQKLRTKIEGAMQRWSDGDYKCKLKDYKTEDGKVDYDAFIAAMDKEDNDNKASKNNRSPEIQAELDRIEKEKQEIQKERLRVSMDKELANIQVSMKLSGEDINNFFKDALAKKRNPYQWLAAGGNLEDLYYIIYRDTIINKRVDERIASTKPTTTSTPPVSNPAKPSGKLPNDNGVSLDDILRDAAKR